MAAVSYGTLHDHGASKLTKCRTRNSVKPILRKLHSSSSYSEKNSLDLDRGWNEQHSPHLGYLAPSVDDYYYSSSSTAATTTAATTTAATTPASQKANPDDLLYSHPYYQQHYTASTAHNINFSSSLSPADLSLAPTNGTIHSVSSPTVTPALTTSSASTTIESTASITSPASHIRSTSGASQFSIATSTGSAGTARNAHGGSFIHPFQQTPRASTPPLLSYANSRTSLDTLGNGNITAARDSPTTIDENDGELEPFSLPTAASSRPIQGSLHSSSHRRPSLATGGSSPQQQQQQQLNDVLPRLSTSRRPTRSSDVQLSATPSVTVVDDSPVAQQHLPASATATSALSPLRSSLDMNNFRLRSRSDVDTSTRQEQVRAARRKFEEKERAKQEKYAREQTRKQQQHQQKSRKGSLGTRSSTSEQRPSAVPRRSTANERSALEASNGLFSHETEELPQPPATPTAAARAATAPTDMSDVRFEHNNRRRDAKRKTTGAWTAFMLWFRTRLLKLGRR